MSTGKDSFSEKKMMHGIPVNPADSGRFLKAGLETHKSIQGVCVLKGKGLCLE